MKNRIFAICIGVDVIGQPIYIYHEF